MKNCILERVSDIQSHFQGLGQLVCHDSLLTSVTELAGDSMLSSAAWYA